MTALGKYHIFQADTLDGIKRYRALIEQTLRRTDLRPDHRAELEIALGRALDKLIAVQMREEEDNEEEQKKKDGEGSTEGSGGDQQSGGSGGDGQGGGSMGDHENNRDGDDGLDEELVALLLLMSEQDCQETFMPDAVMRDPDITFAAATLVLDREQGVAQVHESYSLRNENSGNARSDLLPSLELHVANLGVRVMQLKVQPDAVPLFQQKLGYVPYGKILTQKGGPLQRMRKTLVNSARLGSDVPT